MLFLPHEFQRGQLWQRNPLTSRSCCFIPLNQRSQFDLEGSGDEKRRGLPNVLIQKTLTVYDHILLDILRTCGAFQKIFDRDTLGLGKVLKEIKSVLFM